MAARTESVALPVLNLAWRQLAGLAGIAGVVLFVVGSGLQGAAPMPDEPAADVRQWYVDNQSAFLTGNLIVSIGVILGLLPFFAHLRGVLAKAEGGEATWSRIVFLSSILFIFMGGVASTFLSALAADAAALEDDSVVLALQYLSYSMFAFVPFTLVPFFLGVSVVTLRTGVFPAWVAWLSLLAGGLGVVSIGGTLDVTEVGVFSILGYLSLLGLGLVVLAMSFSILRSKEE